MKNVIKVDLDRCVGCNRCIRVCPIDEANFVYKQNDGKIKVKIDNERCIACGNCLKACHHGSRDYGDDTERFFNDLRSGVTISMFAAPAVKSNFNNYGRLFAWLHSLGVKVIYDVSLGADICTWAHIRHIQKNGPKPIISQPCPAIVNYILIHRNELLRFLSPVHSPMLCTAVYMSKYEMVPGKIAALSPCVAKTYEFEATHLVEYNITFKKLHEYMQKHNIMLPTQEKDFDNYKAGLGSLYPMPGGLKESVEHYVGKGLRVDKSEGTSIVYKALDEYSHQSTSRLPVLFDVLNCMEGCNAGTGCMHDINIFDINTKMDNLRQEAIAKDNLKYIEELFRTFDETLALDDFLRQYATIPKLPIYITEEKLGSAFAALGKNNEASKHFDCGACGCDTCYEMAKRVAKGISIPEHCIEKMHSEALSISESNLSRFDTIIKESGKIKEMSSGITANIENITEAITSYDRMVMEIERIAEKVNIISLNASVEAAKAGSYGLAFDVVAKEIRTLADSSARSAMRTKETSKKANKAIKVMTEAVADIDENAKSSYEHIKAAADNTRKILNKGD